MQSDRPVILIVDDEERIRAGLADYFEDEGFAALTAGSAEEGLYALAGNRVALCTVDIRLPGESGNQFIARAHAVNPALKFLIYTGSADYELPEALRAISMTDADVFIKPVEDLGLLLAAANRLLGREKP
ncbi:MAG: response regulator [Desulfovibrionaceae bacterium]|nr:response regulator [Desulfovibrionaceae bacterium]MBF0513470.1 response regulator [Desulfovibrionaceae bacterium]